jgi:hypothetical protein
VKLEWRVPEPIKAGGEVLRGVLVICTKELSESEAKAAVTKSKNKSKRHEQDTYNRNVRIEHIQLDLTGIEGKSRGEVGSKGRGWESGGEWRSEASTELTGEVHTSYCVSSDQWWVFAQTDIASFFTCETDTLHG